tara:strand:- start:709 stop:1401 length:693 start_codon:yes stop_codon:yes gene_type:complete
MKKKESLILVLILFLILFLLFSCIKKNNKEQFYQYPVKGDINLCYSNVMSKKEEDILYQLIDIWNKVSGELDIKWSVCAGSYIGLIRDGGRVPWDDDFDLVIMKKDLYKMSNIDKKLSKYNVSVSKFWGGYKIFFNDNRGITKFNNYGWNWPFIDIFAIDKDKECGFLDKSEFPLKKVKFGNTHVFVYQNPLKNRKCINKTKWRNELLDTGYRHQIERKIKINCSPKKYM